MNSKKLINHILYSIGLLVANTWSSGSIAACQANTVRVIAEGQLVDNGNGTVSDIKTGLMWKQCPETLNTPGCSGSPTLYTWQQALQQAQTVNQSGGFAGYKNWRLPNIKELFSLVDIACSPVVNGTRFPGSSVNLTSYWSSSAKVQPDASDKIASADFSDYGYGNVVWAYKFNKLALRLVRDNK